MYLGFVLRDARKEARSAKPSFRSEELGKLRLHLRDVVAENVEDLLRGSRNVFGIRFERCAEGGKVGEALLPIGRAREASAPSARCSGGKRRGSAPRKSECIWDSF